MRIMKIRVWICILLLFFSVAGMTGAYGAAEQYFGSPVKAVFRPYLGAGVTAAGLPGAECRFAMRSGVQVLCTSGATRLFFGAGLDAGFMRFGRNSNKASLDAGYVLAVGEMSVPGFLFQAGFGYWFDMSAGAGAWPGILCAGGLVIPITDRMHMPLIIRADFVFAEDTRIPLSFGAGLSWYLTSN